MARFPRTGFSTLSFPSFRGATSQLVLANVVVFFVLLLLEFAAPRMALMVVSYFSLTPAFLLRGWLWQPVTYSFLNAGVLFAVLLGFMVVAVWESYDAAKTNAATEAAALVPLYRATDALPKEAGDKLRELTREYAHQVIDDEWPTQAATGQGSSKARKAIGDLFRAFGPEGPITATTSPAPTVNSATLVSA